VNIYAALSDQTIAEVMRDVGGKPFSEFKPMLADLAVDKIAPISGEMARLMTDVSEIDRILADGAARARAIAHPILQQTYHIMGMVGPSA
jgi:tryptophanyl-tRNA synthetase